MKKTIITVSTVVVLVVAYWLISPLWRNKTLNEELPGLKSAMEQMTSEEQDSFMKEMSVMKDVNNTGSDKMETSAKIISSADLVASAHEVSGTVSIIESNGKRYLRFENLDTVNGPDLKIYLSADLDAKDYVDLGGMKANKGNINYEIPEGTDVSKYNIAMIWCRAFRVLFSYGELK